MAAIIDLFRKLESDLQIRLLSTVAVVLFSWVIHRLVMRVVRHRTEDVRIRYKWRKTSVYACVSIALFLLGTIWFSEFSSVGTFLGLVSAALTIALRDLVANFAGWVFLLTRRPFEVGDRIQIGSHAGDVIDVRVFQFTLLEIGNWVNADQSTGRIIHVPNGRVLTEPVANYSKGFRFIWHEIPVLVTFESNWRLAKTILQRIADKHAEHLSEEAQGQVREAARKFMVFYSKLTPIVYTKVVDSGVLLTVRHLCEPRRRRGVEEAIWEDVLDEFAKAPDIDFAYPTTRFYSLRAEGGGAPPAGGSFP